MSTPRTSSWLKLKRIARYLVDKPEVLYEYAYQDRCQTIDVITDSDWAGCEVSRRSTSGGIVKLGRHAIMSWSTTQTSIALSSAESEYYALITGVTRALGLRSCAAELGLKVHVRAWTDSSAAKSFASRRGLGKMRHIETRCLWLQEVVSRKLVTLLKIHGKWQLESVETFWVKIKRKVFHQRA